MRVDGEAKTLRAGAAVHPVISLTRPKLVAMIAVPEAGHVSHGGIDRDQAVSPVTRALVDNMFSRITFSLTPHPTATLFLGISMSVLATNCRSSASEESTYPEPQSPARGSDVAEAPAEPERPDVAASAPSTPLGETPQGPAGDAVSRSSGSASCRVADGYQTIRFSDGSEYTGNFEDCVPLPGPAHFKKGSLKLSGHATPGADGVVLKTPTHQITIGLRLGAAN